MYDSEENNLRKLGYPARLGCVATSASDEIVEARDSFKTACLHFFYLTINQHPHRTITQQTTYSALDFTPILLERCFEIPHVNEEQHIKSCSSTTMARAAILPMPASHSAFPCQLHHLLHWRGSQLEVQTSHLASHRLSILSAAAILHHLQHLHLTPAISVDALVSYLSS